MNVPTDNKTDFYIGWQEHAPPQYAKRSKTFIWGVGLLTILTAVLLVTFQKPMVNAVFEFGTLTEVEGTLTLYPFPMLKTLENGLPKSFLLVGFGKHGAENTLQEIASRQGQRLAGQKVTLRGTQIFYDGKFALELTEGVNSFVKSDITPDSMAKQKQALGYVRLKGEILDTKCALGVMNPATGKPHRSCAINCIAGGVPPMLRVLSKSEETQYILLLSESGQPVNQEVLPFVADQINICGKLVQEDDWLVLYTNPSQHIQRIKPYGTPENLTTCGP